MEQFAAHVRYDENGDAQIQTVDVHNRNVADLARQFALSFSDGRMAYLAGLHHDDGKISKEFQQRILSDGSICDHATAGAYELHKAGHLIEALCVMGHHGGLPDLGSQVQSKEAVSYYGRIARAKANGIPAYEKQGAIEAVTEPIEKSFAGSILVKMIYSCVVDADCLDTEAFMSGRKYQPHPHGGDVMAGLLEKLLIYIREQGWDKPANELNRMRQEIFRTCLTKGEQEEPGIYMLGTGTGSGKTTALAAFGLAHAAKWDKDRLIYLSPYNSIIEQNADIYRAIFGEDQVLEHHSGHEFSGDPVTGAARLAENWDFPFIVTTSVRFFESFLSDSRWGMRRLHNVANSVIVFDEVQSIPFEHMIPCVALLAVLARDFGCTVLLCTATNPSLDRFLEPFGMTAKPLIPDVDVFNEKLHRTTIVMDEGLKEPHRMAETLSRQEQVLCIVNTRRKAREIYRELDPDGTRDDTFHLSTLMCPYDRRRTLAEIIRRLKEGKPVRVVTTSLIEAGVDVDFPVVYREFAGLDSIWQAAGRCNRENKLKAEDAVVHVFKMPGHVSKDIDIRRSATRSVMKSREVKSGALDMNSGKTVELYFNRLYLGSAGTDKMDTSHAWFDMEGTNADAGKWAFRTLGKAFHMIEQGTKTVYVPIADGTVDNRALLGKLFDGTADAKEFRQSQQYAVNIYPNHFDRLVQIGAVKVPTATDWEGHEVPEDYGVLTDVSWYDRKAGLAMDTG